MVTALVAASGAQRRGPTAVYGIDSYYCYDSVCVITCHNHEHNRGN